MNPRIVAKQIYTNARYGRAYMIRLDDAIGWVMRWQIPRYDLIVGVPRAGLAFASVLALRQNVPVTTPDHLPQIWEAKAKIPQSNAVRNILVLDDVVVRGEALNEAYEKVKAAYPDAKVDRGAVLITEDRFDRVDVFAQVIRANAILEWDMPDISPTLRVASDLDGVLAEEWPEDLPPDKIDWWLATVKPLTIPTHSLYAVVTNRPEKYRVATVWWLKRYGIRYERLIMRNDSRSELDFKTDVLNEIAPGIYFESRDPVAFHLHWRTSVPVYCPTSGVFYND